MASDARREDRLPRTFAQWYCVIAGATLLVVGLLGFFVSTEFNTGTDIEGDQLFGFEVNGWHNIVHLGSGLLLLAAANTRPTAKSVALTFGIVYGLVTLWGFFDGNTVFALIPVNTADNFLHLALSVVAIAAALMSPTTKRQQRDKRSGHGRERERDRDEGEGPGTPIERREGGVDAPILGGTTSGTRRAPSGTGTDTDVAGGRFDRAGGDRDRERSR